MPEAATDDLEKRRAALKAEEITVANRELAADIAHAALDFWRRMGELDGDGLTIDGAFRALMTFRDEMREAYALRRSKPPYVQAESLTQ